MKEIWVDWFCYRYSKAYSSQFWSIQTFFRDGGYVNKKILSCVISRPGDVSWLPIVCDLSVRENAHSSRYGWDMPICAKKSSKILSNGSKSAKIHEVFIWMMWCSCSNFAIKWIPTQNIILFYMDFFTLSFEATKWIARYVNTHNQIY